MRLEHVVAVATIGTALGTLLLAAATFVLARKTGALVDEAQAQAASTSASLEAQMQPLISDVRTHDLVGMSEPMLGELGPSRCPLRNVGSGPGKILHVCVVVADLRFPGVSDVVVLPAGEETFFRPNVPEARPVEHSLGRAFVNALEDADVLEYQVAYSTPAGTQLTVSKARMFRERAVGEPGELEWRVRDVTVLYAGDARFEADVMRREVLRPEWETLPVRHA